MTIRTECTVPVYNLFSDVGHMVIQQVKDLNPRGLSKEQAYKLFETNLIFLKSFGVFIFIVMAIYRINEFQTIGLLGQWNFFIESIMYGLFIAVPFFILMSMRRSSLSKTKIFCYSTALGFFFFALNYVFEASGFMDFSFRDNKLVDTDNYIVTDLDTRILTAKNVKNLILPATRHNILIINTDSEAESDLILYSKSPIVNYGQYTMPHNDGMYSYTLLKNSSVKIIQKDNVYTVQEYGLWASLFPNSAGGTLTSFEQFIESYGFASKFIISVIIAISFLILTLTVPLSQRNLNVNYKMGFNYKKSILFFLLIETFLLFGIIGSIPMTYMSYNRYKGQNDFLKSHEDQEEFIKIFFMNVMIMCIANIVFQTSGFYNVFLG